jgi:hypothetical protein
METCTLRHLRHFEHEAVGPILSAVPPPEWSVLHLFHPEEAYARHDVILQLVRLDEGFDSQ